MKIREVSTIEIIYNNGNTQIGYKDNIQYMILDRSELSSIKDFDLNKYQRLTQKEANRYNINVSIGDYAYIISRNYNLIINQECIDLDLIDMNINHHNADRCNITASFNEKDKIISKDIIVDRCETNFDNKVFLAHNINNQDLERLDSHAKNIASLIINNRKYDFSNTIIGDYKYYYNMAMEELINSMSAYKCYLDNKAYERIKKK